MKRDLFDVDAHGQVEAFCEGAALLRGFVVAAGAALLEGIRAGIAQSPLRQMVTPGGKRMAVAMTNCGPLGWISDRRGYRYTDADPLTGLPWPAMPPAFLVLAREAAARAGFADFVPDACLVNRYETGTRLSLHQDRDEKDYGQPIVSVSLGVGAVFLFGGLQRADPPLRVRLEHGDVVAWGGPARLRYHGVLPLEEGLHPLTGALRFNLTFRKAG
jgi:alkylated DNA repair protein (DNA oxidative demethylase)